MAMCYQMFYCGPLVRLIFRCIFRKQNSEDPVPAEGEPC
jgi:hypothetical protein